MPSFQAGQRLPAGWLNALATQQVSISGGPTSGTTTLQLTGVLSIDAAPFDRTVTPMFSGRLQTSVAGDVYDMKIIDTPGGNVYAEGRWTGAAGAAGNEYEECTINGEAFTLAANTSIDLVVTIVRFAGTGTAQVAGTSIESCNLTADISPVA